MARSTAAQTQLATVVSAPFAGLDGHQYATVKLDVTGIELMVGLVNGTYAPGTRTVVQFFPYGAYPVALGPLM